MEELLILVHSFKDFNIQFLVPLILGCGETDDHAGMNM